MLEIGGQHPVTALFGINPSVLPDFETPSLAITDEQLSPNHAANQGSVRLREIAVKCMIEATAQSRLAIADKRKPEETADHLSSKQVTSLTIIANQKDFMQHILQAGEDQQSFVTSLD